MKKLKVFAIAVFLLLFLCGISFAAKIELVQEDPYSAILTMKISANTDVSAFNFQFSEAPQTAAYVGQSDKIMDTNADNGIIYGLNNTLIANGNVAKFAFAAPTAVGSSKTITYKIFVAANPAANKATPEVIDGSITVFFRTSDLVATVAQVLGKGTSGLDVNKDTNIDALDVQYISTRVK